MTRIFLSKATSWRRHNWRHVLCLLIFGTMIARIRHIYDMADLGFLEDSQQSDQATGEFTLRANEVYIKGLNGRLVKQQLTFKEESKREEAKTERSSRKTKTKPKTFDWDWIEPSVLGTCGFSKCFFRSKPVNLSIATGTNVKKGKHVSSNAEETYGYGYLVAFDENANLTMGWELAKYLKTKHGLHHLYDSKPERIPVSRRLVNYTQKAILSKVEKKSYHKVSIEEFKKRLEKVKLITSKRKLKSLPTFQIQRVKILPSKTLEWGFTSRRNKRCRRKFPDFAAAIPDKFAFFHNLQKEAEILKKVLRQEEWIAYDFQLIIDREGRTYHIDLDRKPRENSSRLRGLSNRASHAYKALKAISWKVLSTIKDVKIDDTKEFGKGLKNGRDVTELLLSEQLLVQARNISSTVLDKIC